MDAKKLKRNMKTVVCDACKGTGQAIDIEYDVEYFSDEDCVECGGDGSLLVHKGKLVIDPMNSTVCI
ncbi:hypothetical protein D3C87_574160 [compost metagenome]